MSGLKTNITNTAFSPKDAPLSRDPLNPARALSCLYPRVRPFHLKFERLAWFHSQAIPAAGSPGNVDAFGSGSGGDGLPERPQKTTREVLSACALTLLRLLSQAAQHHDNSGGSGGAGTRPEDAETTAKHANSANHSEDGDIPHEKNSNIDGNDGNDNDNDNKLLLTRPPPWSQAKSSQHLTGEGKANTDTDTVTVTTNAPNAPSDNHDNSRRCRSNGGIPDAIVAVVGSCLANVAQAVDLAAGPRGALESVLTLLLPPAGLLVREQAALTLGAITEQGFQILADLREARAAEASASSSPGGGGGGGDGERFSSAAVGGALTEIGEGRREGKRLLLWRLFCTGVVGGTGAQVGAHEEGVPFLLRHTVPV